MNPLFNNEKHYLTMNNYCMMRFGKKTFRISLNGNFTCPNRDGTISTLGCIFCSKKASGDFGGDKNLPIKEQFMQIKQMMQKKWPNGYYIAYFQANTNTYGSLEKLKSVYEQIVTKDGLLDENIKVLSIATRPDCITLETVEYLAYLNQFVEVWVELGFQTSNEKTAELINRGYNNCALEKAVALLKAKNLHTIIHVINGLMDETKEDMLNTIKFVNNLKPNGVKIHMLHIMKATPLEDYYKMHPFKMLSLEEYVDIVVSQLELLDENIVIHRLTGDAPKDLLIEPLWTLKKFVVLNEIDKKMRSLNVYQGDLCTK